LRRIPSHPHGLLGDLDRERRGLAACGEHLARPSGDRGGDVGLGRLGGLVRLELGLDVVPRFPHPHEPVAAEAARELPDRPFEALGRSLPLVLELNLRITDPVDECTREGGEVGPGHLLQGAQERRGVDVAVVRALRDLAQHAEERCGAELVGEHGEDHRPLVVDDRVVRLVREARGEAQDRG
jgi:hypothetical protein